MKLYRQRMYSARNVIHQLVKQKSFSESYSYYLTERLFADLLTKKYLESDEYKNAYGELYERNLHSLKTGGFVGDLEKQAERDTRRMLVHNFKTEHYGRPEEITTASGRKMNVYGGNKNSSFQLKTEEELKNLSKLEQARYKSQLNSHKRGRLEKLSDAHLDSMVEKAEGRGEISLGLSGAKDGRIAARNNIIPDPTPNPTPNPKPLSQEAKAKINKQLEEDAKEKARQQAEEKARQTASNSVKKGESFFQRHKKSFGWGAAAVGAAGLGYAAYKSSNSRN